MYGGSRATAEVTDDQGIVRILNCVPSEQTEADWRFHNADAAGLVADKAVPKAFDLRDGTDMWWTIGDQRATGSCVGWATADSVLRWQFVRDDRIDGSDFLAPRFIWMAAKETDEFVTQPTTFVETAGTSLKAALDVARKWGAVQDALLPFDSAELYDGEVATLYAIASQLKIAAYFNLGRELSDWRRWLSSTGPILTRLDVDSTWDNATANSGKLTTYRPSTARGGHAVALVGYTARGFTVRNSWGTGWGDNGYAYATNAYAAAAFTEAYGVVL